MKPYSESCTQNQDAILAIIEPLLRHTHCVLEIGSGTGQHAVHFAKQMPHLTWHCSDQAQNHAGINQWLDEAQLANTPPPISLNVSHDSWPKLQVDAIFSANAVHIMSWPNVLDFIHGAAKQLDQGGYLILYGPFNYHQQYTSESNAWFDLWLKQQNPKSAIRDFEAIDEVAQRKRLILKDDFAMPANNRILVWEKR